jgi:hypothetical protein
LIAGGKILTFDNATLPFAPEDKFTLLTGVCTENSPFAVFGRKTSQSSALVPMLILCSAHIDSQDFLPRLSRCSLENQRLMLSLSQDKGQGLRLMEKHLLKTQNLMALGKNYQACS